MMINYLIVGQGIAGTWVSYFLQKAGKSFKLIDHANENSSSKVAAGIINPITGRNFVKTWLADELIAFADHSYPEMEAMLHDHFYTEQKIYKLFSSVRDHNEWSIKAENPDYNRFLKSKEISYLDKDKIKNPFGSFEIAEARSVNGKKMLRLYRENLNAKGLLIDSIFAHHKLTIQDGGINYDGLQAEHVIFCDGRNVEDNPLFNWLPLALTKGEALIVRMEGFNIDYIVNGKLIIMPLKEKDLYYIGSTNDWNDLSASPTEQMYLKLNESLRQITPLPYTVIHHLAAIRPTVKDRRPIIGVHPEFHNISIFNGMGTKGFSLAPYFANHFIQHLIDGKSLHREVNIARNFAFYETR